MPLGLRIGRVQHDHLAPSTPRNAWQSSVSSVLPARHRPIAPSPSQTSTRGTAPSARATATSRRTGPGRPRRDQQRRQPPRVARTITSTGNCVGGPDLPEPHRQLIGGNQKSHWPISPADTSSARPGPAADTPAAARDPVPEHRDRPLPADPLRDHRRRHRRPRLQQLPDPRLDLVHHRPRGHAHTAADRPQRNAACTVFLEHPIARAIALIGIPSARCNRGSQPSPPRPTPHFLLTRLSQGLRKGSIFSGRQGVSFHVPSTTWRSDPTSARC